MRQWIFLALTVFVLSDAWADARAAECMDHACAQACAGVCHSHTVPGQTLIVGVVVPAVQDIAVQDSRIPQQFFVKSLFRPPKASL